MPRRRKPTIRHVTEDELMGVAHIIGGASAGAAALDDIARRRAAGEDPYCYDVGGSYIVGPKIAEAHAPRVEPVPA